LKKRVNGIKDKSTYKHFIFIFKRSLSLGGKTPFGIDCSGFTQMVYKLNGYKLERQQATGRRSFIEESEPGDLAFFDNEEGRITHGHHGKTIILSMPVEKYELID
jgi:hypothetical protein